MYIALSFWRSAHWYGRRSVVGATVRAVFVNITNNYAALLLVKLSLAKICMCMYLGYHLQLEELGRLLPENKEGRQSKEQKQCNEDNPIPPNGIRIGANVIQHLVTSKIRFQIETVSTAIVKLGDQHDTKRVRERAEVLRPLEPRWNQIRRNEKAGKKHLGDKQQRQQLHGELWISNGTSQEHCERSARHGQHIRDAKELAK